MAPMNNDHGGKTEFFEVDILDDKKLKDLL